MFVRSINSSIAPALLIGAVVIFFSSTRAEAQATETPADAQPDTGFWARSNLLGDMAGLRPALDSVGVSFDLQETSEVFGNVSGGLRRGAAYDGVTQMGLVLDTAKAFGWEGGTFNVSAFQIHGRNLSAEKLLSLQTISGIEASRSTRLWELWYQQAFLDGKVDAKIGQQSLDQEFIVSQYSALFINTMMGWPMVPSADLFAGGPAYPLSSLGARLRGQPSDAWTVLGGVFDDNPPGGPFADDSQLRGAEASGTKFNLNTGALFIVELQYAANRAPARKKTDEAAPSGLPGTYKLGAWFDTAGFPDQRFDDHGRSLADPASDGRPRLRQDNFSLYGVVDQGVWSGDTQSVAVFARIMGAPSDRNLIDFSVNAGVVLKAPLPDRGDDSFGVGYGYANVSGRAADLDRDTAFFTHAFKPIRSGEHFVEVTYQWQIAPWWQVQPDFQYIVNPGGGITNPERANQRIGDEAVFGLRTVITF